MYDEDNDSILECLYKRVQYTIYLHRPGDLRGNPDSAALQRPPNDLGLPHGAAVCSQTKHETNKSTFTKQPSLYHVLQVQQLQMPAVQGPGVTYIHPYMFIDHCRCKRRATHVDNLGLFGNIAKSQLVNQNIQTFISSIQVTVQQYNRMNRQYRVETTNMQGENQIHNQSKINK